LVYNGRYSKNGWTLWTSNISESIQELLSFKLDKIRAWYPKNLFPKAETSRLLLQCFKSAWLYAFLHDGLKFPMNYKRLRSASLVNNHDVQWTLGAILYKTRFLPLRAIHNLQTTPHYRVNNHYSSTVIVFFAILIFVILFLYQQKFRSKFRSVFSRRTTINGNIPNGNLHNRYQLLSSVVIDTSPSSVSSMNTFGRLRSV